MNETIGPRPICAAACKRSLDRKHQRIVRTLESASGSCVNFGGVVTQQQPPILLRNSSGKVCEIIDRFDRMVDLFVGCVRRVTSVAGLSTRPSLCLSNSYKIIDLPHTRVLRSCWARFTEMDALCHCRRRPHFSRDDRLRAHSNMIQFIKTSARLYRLWKWA